MMNDRPRARCYVWATWLTKLLAGEDRCWWKAWYKTHYRYDKVPDDPERAAFFREWTAKHDALVQKRAAELRAADWVVKVEDEGQFKVCGDAADLAGKPDIVAMREDEGVLVIDAKAGRRRDSDHWQVLVYAWSLARSWLKGQRIRGEVQYSDGVRAVRELGERESAEIVAAMKKITGPESPSAEPSRNECRYCDVQHCTSRWADETDHDGDAGGAF